MRNLILMSLLFVFSCSPKYIPFQNKYGNAGKSKKDLFVGIRYNESERKTVHCLRDFITGEDPGGTWEQVGVSPQNLTSLLIGDNPCFEWNDKACGLYELRYIVGSPCCRDTATINPLKCCANGYSSCN